MIDNPFRRTPVRSVKICGKAQIEAIVPGAVELHITPGSNAVFITADGSPLTGYSLWKAAALNGDELEQLAAAYSVAEFDELYSVAGLCARSDLFSYEQSQKVKPDIIKSLGTLSPDGSALTHAATSLAKACSIEPDSVQEFIFGLEAIPGVQATALIDAVDFHLVDPKKGLIPLFSVKASGGSCAAFVSLDVIGVSNTPFPGCQRASRGVGPCCGTDVTGWCALPTDMSVQEWLDLLPWYEKSILALNNSNSVSI